MAVQRADFERELNSLLKPELFSDYCPNGLQVEGREQIRKIVTGVTACQALIDAAISASADAILVHHGYFWKGEPPTVTGLRKSRIASLLHNDMNLFAYHLPLDVHSDLGNNVQLGRRLGMEIAGDIHRHNNHPLVVFGRLEKSMSAAEFATHVEHRLGRKPMLIAGDSRSISTLAWCTGAGQGFIELAAVAGMDAYLSGEISEQTTHVAQESGMHYLAAGHHATERYGVQALGEHLASSLGIEHQFIDIENPV